MSNITLGELYTKLTRLLSPVANDLANREAQDILEQVLNINQNELLLNRVKEVSELSVEKINTITHERLTGKPLAYVFEKNFFYSKEFHLSQETLIPRHDTEHLIETVLTSETDQDIFFLELGTGSGIIPEILTEEQPSWRAISVDFSWGALKTAHKNCNAEKIQLLNSDRFSAILPKKQFDFIVSNPPYIPTAVVQNELESCVTDFEPLSALDGGEDGCDFYRYLATIGKEYLKESGRIYLEIGYDQGESVPAILEQEGWNNISVINDFGGRDRVVKASL